MWVMKYECDCIKNMEWVELYGTFIQQQQKVFYLMLLTMFNWIIKIMNYSDEVWSWLHQKYLMSRIIQKLHAIREKPSLTFHCFVDPTEYRW